MAMDEGARRKEAGIAAMGLFGEPSHEGELVGYECHGTRGTHAELEHSTPTDFGRESIKIGKRHLDPLRYTFLSRFHLMPVLLSSRCRLWSVAADVADSN